MRVATEDDFLPKKTSTATLGSKSSKGSSGDRRAASRLMRTTRLAGILLGGLVTFVGAMAIVGLVSDNLWVRLVVALLVVIGFPAFVAERLLKRLGTASRSGSVGDVFAIVLLILALGLVTADVVSKPLFVREGDRYAREGSRTMARIVYFLGGVSPVFPDERGAAPTGLGAPTASSPSTDAAADGFVPVDQRGGVAPTASGESQ